MLSIAAVSDRRADYYLADMGDELRRVVPGYGVGADRFVGRSSADLGLVGPVDRAALQALLEGRHPRLGRMLNSRPHSVVAFDLTFSAPKSVSVLLALRNADTAATVVAGHDRAVHAALDYLEQHALAARRGAGGERSLIATDGLLGASFVHCLSRAADPHLHSHVLVANLVHGEDAKWSALDGRGLFAHAAAAGSLYEAHLRAELSDHLGLSWSFEPRRGWGVAGTDPLLAAAFSGRAAEIREHASAFSATSRAARRTAWAVTRSPKDTSSAAELTENWARRARLAGDRTPEGNRQPTGSMHQRLDEYRFAAVIADASAAGVCRRDAIAAWSQSAGPGIRAPELGRAVDHWAKDPGAVGVGERRRAPASCVPSPHLLRALGPRPLRPEGQAVWRAAAAVIDRYRSRWGTREGPAVAPVRLETLGGPRLADHLEVLRSVRDAWIRLGGAARPGLERDGPSLGR